MRRTHLRGHENILKRLLVHSGALNLGLLMRQTFGVGTPRGLQGHLRALLALFARLWHCLRAAHGRFTVPRRARTHAAAPRAGNTALASGDARLVGTGDRRGQ